MKTITGFICMTALVCILGTGCDKDNEQSKGYVKPEKNLERMLNENIVVILRNAGYNEPILDAVMINSMEEMPKADFDGNPLEFPEIDFKSHTLIVGFHVAWNGGVYIADRMVDVGASEITLTLILKVAEGPHNEADIPKPFWILCPKLPTMPINIVYAGDNLPWARD
jgi:hypothetical protein